MQRRSPDGRVDRRLHHHTITRGEQPAQRHIETWFYTRQHDNGFGRNPPAVTRLKHFKDGFNQGSGRACIAEYWMRQPGA